MSGLVLTLAPGERILINGAVIENGDRRSRLSIKTPNANILRLKDAIHPDAACTPVRRVCYIAQLVLSGIEQLSQVFFDDDSRRSLDAATSATLDERYYQALKALRELLPREDRLLEATSQ